jgi:polyisoprenoid-binding protein YceI
MASPTTSTSSSRPRRSSSSERGRRARLRVAAAVAALASASAAGAPVTYRFDPDQTFITFEVRHFGTSTLRGRFGPVQGDVQLDRAAGTGDLRLRIPVGTVDTGVPALDARLKEPDLLAVKEYPEAYYIATRFRFDGNGVAELRGEFILRGTSEPLSLVARRFGCRQDEHLRVEVCGGDFEGDLKRGRFGATFGEPFVGDDVHLVVQVEGSAAN